MEGVSCALYGKLCKLEWGNKQIIMVTIQYRGVGLSNERTVFSALFSQLISSVLLVIANNFIDVSSFVPVLNCAPNYAFRTNLRPSRLGNGNCLRTAVLWKPHFSP